MKNHENTINNYLKYCITQKRLDEKTIKAYRIDLTQFSNKTNNITLEQINVDILEDYISFLNNCYKPKTVKRKLASIKAFFHYLEYKDIIIFNPFNKMVMQFREPVILPKVIPLHTVEHFLSTIYKQLNEADTPYKRKNALRDVAAAEILFSTGICAAPIMRDIGHNEMRLFQHPFVAVGNGETFRSGFNAELWLKSVTISIARLSEYDAISLSQVNSGSPLFTLS